MHLPQDFHFAFIMTSRIIKFGHLAVVRQDFGFPVLFNPGHNVLLQFRFPFQMSIHSHLHYFREEIYRYSVGPQIGAIHRKRHIRTRTFNFNRFNHAFRNIVPLDVIANVKQEDLVNHVNERHDEHVAAQKTSQKERKDCRDFAYNHRNDILERNHFLVQYSPDNDPDIQNNITHQERIEQAMSPTVSRHIISDASLDHIFHRLVVCRKIPDRHSQCTNRKAHENKSQVQPFRNTHLANFQKCKEHEHWKEGPAKVVHLIGNDSTFNSFRKT